MGHCQDCQWWDVSPARDSTYRKCFQPVSDDIQAEQERPQGISYQENEGWDAFWTGPEFGCVNFEAIMLLWRCANGHEQTTPDLHSGIICPICGGMMEVVEGE